MSVPGARGPSSRDQKQEVERRALLRHLRASHSLRESSVVLVVSMLWQIGVIHAKVVELRLICN